MKNLLVKGGGIGVGSSRVANSNPTTPPKNLCRIFGQISSKFCRIAAVALST